MTAFPASSNDLASLWIATKTQMQSVKSQATAIHNGGTNSLLIMNLASFCLACQSAINAVNEMAAVPGAAPYIQQQVGNSTFDVTGAVNTIVPALTNMVSWLVANLPTDANGWLLSSKFNGPNPTSLTQNTLSGGQVASGAPVLAALLAAIS